MIFNLPQFSENTAVISDSGEFLTYSNLNAKVKFIAEKLQSRSLAFCLCENSIGSLCGYLAFLEASVPAIILDAHKEVSMLIGLIEIYKPQYIWMPNTTKIEIGTCVLEYDCYKLMETGYADYPIHEDVTLLLTTSGSTGSPKLVKLTEENLLSNAESIAEYLEITALERPVTSLPMYYSFGLSVINSHLIKGATILLTDKTVIQKEFWSFVKDQKVTSIAGVPYTYEILRRLRFFRMDLPHLKTLTQAGGKLNATLVKEYVEQCQTAGKRFIVMYGQTEASPRMSYSPAENTLDKNASIGIAIPGGEFSLIDGDGKEIIDPNVDGELVYKGPNVFMGYAECPADLSKGDEHHGELRTGDVAYRDADGYYYITGRLKRFVKIWGNRCNLDATEQIVKSVITNCACAGVDDKITVFVTEEGLESSIKDMLVTKTGLNVRAFDVRVINEIPKNTSGKILYSELQKLL